MPSYHKVVFFAPYLEMAQVAKEVSHEFQLDIQVEAAHLPEALDRAKVVQADGFICRGGTALKIKEQLDVPVIELKVTGYDLLRALHKAKNFGKEIAAIGFPNIIYGAADVSSILDVKITEIFINSDQECKQALEKAGDLGVDVIVGDAIAVKTAQSKGIKGFLITSDSKEAIFNAYDEMQRILDIRQKELAKTKQVETILRFAHSGIVAVDSSGMITVFNPEVEKLMGIKAELVLGRRIDDVLPNSGLIRVMKEQKTEINQLYQIKNNYIVTHRVPIIINGTSMGAVATFQRLDQIQSIERKARKELLQKGHVARATFKSIIGVSEQLQLAIKTAESFSKYDLVVMLNGETGTGKELFAQSIHNASLRKDGPFVAVNCAALPETLLESELFGYVEGAFTGARSKGRVGLFEQAHGGTLFLDELGEIPLSIQPRLLRAIQEGQIQRIGDDKLISVNVRIIAATNKNLKAMVEKGEFREDLYYRINVLNVLTPPLRERKADIPVLVNHFINRFSDRYKWHIAAIEEGALQALYDYDWPGNVRELKNIIEKLVILKQGALITKAEVERLLPRSSQPADLNYDLDSLIIKTIVHALQVCKNNKTEAAKMLGIDRSTLWRKLKQYNL